MALEVILQGLTAKTHILCLRDMFATAVQKAIVSVAFASENGVRLIEGDIAPHAAHLTVFVGIRNDITSAQALRRLLGLGLTLYAVDTGSRSLLFHPKLYYVRAATSAQITVGSANLTPGGLNNNVEASVWAKLDLALGEHAKISKKTENLFDGLAAAHPGNVLPINTVAQIDALLAAGRLNDETVSRVTRAITSNTSGHNDTTPRMKMVPKPVSPRPAAAAPVAVVAAPVVAAAPATVLPSLELVWESKPLSRRSLGIPTNPNSNPTGSTTLGSGTFDQINRVTYFRNTLFGHLTWVANGRIEVATQRFDLVIKGVFAGSFQMTLRHSLTRAAAAPVDKNSPSGLSWNEARPLIAREDLLGRTMRLWRSTTDRTKFQIEID